MTVTKASAQYKKQDGTLQFDTAKQVVTWIATASGTAPTLSIALPDITNLQQTPADKPKVALRIVVQATTASTPENYQFNFTSKTAAREEQVAITVLYEMQSQPAKLGLLLRPPTFLLSRVHQLVAKVNLRQWPLLLP